MNDERTNSNNLIDTTDCLEAVETFRGWKNALFVIVLLSLLLTQVCFWLVDTGCVKADTGTQPAAEQKPQAPATAPEDTRKAGEAAKTGEIKNAPAQTIAEPNQPAEAPAPRPEKKTGFTLRITFKHIAWLIRFLNFLLIPTATLYCLTILFALKVSLLGRMGGINHIARAFFLSLVFVVFLLPWQLVFGHIVPGLIYTSQELLSRYNNIAEASIFARIYYYLRFVVYWLVLLLLLIFSHIRSARWTRAIFRRLEII